MPTIAEILGRSPKTGMKTGASSPQVRVKKGKKKPTPLAADEVAAAFRRTDTDAVASPQSLPSRLLEGLSSSAVRQLLDDLQRRPERYVATRAVIIALAIIVIGAGVYINGSIFSLPFAHAVDARILEALVGLLIIALFVERAQHVYIGVIRGFGRAQLDRGIARAREILEAVVLMEPRDPELHREVLKALHNRQDQLAYYRLTTRKGAFIAGLATGVAIALIGPRVLEAVVDPNALKNLVDCAALAASSVSAAFADPCLSQAAAKTAATQLWWFNAIDIITTGGLIGGGAEGIHKIVAAITGTADKIRKQQG